MGFQVVLVEGVRFGVRIVWWVQTASHHANTPIDRIGGCENALFLVSKGFELLFLAAVKKALPEKKTTGKRQGSVFSSGEFPRNWTEFQHDVILEVFAALKKLFKALLPSHAANEQNSGYLPRAFFLFRFYLNLSFLKLLLNLLHLSGKNQGSDR